MNLTVSTAPDTLPLNTTTDENGVWSVRDSEMFENTTYKVQVSYLNNLNETINVTEQFNTST